ncbi:hypothetical protein DE146DRAFT_756379 [Phaeosphaeria sp. MPI-PUGE-AT-0046c]|nr:hypothetical protein DE146DRAFT_756379 [Phaeosphaeria sp. MPI-PUGE-AT-0046c]
MRENPIRNWNINVCRIGPLIVKRCSGERLLQEAENMIYLKAHSEVRVPEVYAVLTTTHKTGVAIYYLITEYIEGETLTGAKWMTFSHDTRDKILSKISEQFHLLRATRSPGFFGRVHSQSFHPMSTLLRGRATKPSGLYNTYEDFLSALYRAVEICAVTLKSGPELHPDTASPLSRFNDTRATCKGTRPVFTHVNPHLMNIIVRPFYNTEENTEDWEVTLIDFEDCGFLPAWMQAVTLRERLNMWSKGNSDFGQDNDEEWLHFLNTIIQGFGEDYTEQVEYMHNLYNSTRSGVM